MSKPLKPSLAALGPKPPETVAPPVAPAPETVEASAAPVKKPKPSRTERKGFTTFITQGDYQTLRRISFEQERPIQAIVDEALADLFAKHGYALQQQRGG